MGITIEDWYKSKEEVNKSVGLDINGDGDVFSCLLNTRHILFYLDDINQFFEYHNEQKNCDKIKDIIKDIENIKIIVMKKLQDLVIKDLQDGI